MKNRLTKLLAALLCPLMLLSALPGGLIFAEESITPHVDFSTSFEDGENDDLLRSKEDGTAASGVIHTEYGKQGPGLKVNISTVSGSPDYIGSESKYNLFDGKPRTKFITGSSKGYVQYALTEAASVVVYSVSSANDEPTRDPKNWTLYGSADGKSWTALDSREGVVFADRFEIKSFAIDSANVGEYLWYKLDVTSNQGASMLQFSGIDLYAAGEGIPEGEAPQQPTGITYGEVNPESVSATQYNEASQIPQNLFDGSTGTKYLTMNGSCFVQFALTEPMVINFYAITSANDHDPRDPRDWNFYGSVDGSTWTLLDSQENADFAKRFQTNTYPIADETAYQYFKLDVLSNNGTDAVGFNIVQMSELCVGFDVNAESGEDEPEPTYATVDTATVTATASDSGKEAPYLFDGNIDSRYLTRNAACFVQFALTEPMVVNFYEITSGKDQPARDPKDWDFYGSTDGESWVLLDHHENESFAERKQTISYSFENTTPYLWYKWDITSNHGTDTAGLVIVQVGELALGYFPVETEEEDVDAVATVDTATVTSTAADSGKEAIYLFDGNIDSRYLTRNAACFVQFALTEPMVVNYYDITTGKDQPARDPKDWDFYGSTDGETWVLLDHREDEELGDRKATVHYEFNNQTAYTWYKWDITDNHGTDTAGLVIVQVGELALGHKAGLVFEEEDVDAVATVDVSTVTGTPGGGAGKELVQLFDGDADARYLTSNTACYVQFAITEPMVVNYYDVTSAKDTPTRDPRDWDFYGSNDGESWTLLDHRSGQSFDARKQVYHYEFNNDTAYLYYKWDITANNGETRIQVAELTLGHIAGLVVEEVITDTPATVDTATVTATAPDGSNTPDRLFDGNTGTKYLTRNSACDVVFSLAESSLVNYYTVTSANDHDPRDPKDWNFYGSADGSSWTLLDSRENEDFPERYQTNRYSFYNETPYLWYKWEVTSNNGKDAVGLDIVQASEFTLGYTDEKIAPPEEEEIVPIVVDKSSITGTAELSSGEGKSKLFDGSVDTKLVVRGSSFFVSFALTEAATVRAYSLTSANDWAARDPAAWTVEASNDGETWVTLDEQSGVVFGERNETRVFRIDNTTPYLYYKLDVTQHAGTNDYTQLAEFTLLDGADLPETIPGMESREDFGPLNAECNTPGAWTGSSCLAVFGEQSEKTSFARNVLFKDLSIPVDANTRLSYVIFPGLFDLNSYDYEYTSCRVIIDLHFTDGTYLSQLGAVDQNGSLMTPQGQVDGECLVTAQWNYVESCIGDVANGKTIDRICVLFEMEDAEDASRFLTFFDDLRIESKPETVYEHLSDYISILRGTNNDSAFSRGLCTPGVTLPQGFNFISPVNNPGKSTACYNYQLSGTNHPMDSITVTHAPNYWIGSYGSWQFMANTTVNAANNPTAIEISSEARQSNFTHLNETANAHYYAVTFNEGTPASGVKVEVTPTSHAASVRFTFPATSANVSVIFDSLWGAGTLTFGDDGKSFVATTNHNSAGSSTMYVVGSFSENFASASAIGKQGIVTFAPGTTTVIMTFATSFISAEQAAHSLALEIGDSSFDEIFAAAQSEWDALCGKFEIEGASYYQLLSFYSNLYRMYAFPNLLSENEGTNENPVWVYKSPYTKQKTSGILYTNNGFWDTYRTTWAGYSLFTADKDGELLNGIAQHYVDSGWLPRWLGPGAVNCMVGTSSDIIFADAFVKGIDFNYEAAWDSMVKNASAYASDMGAGGRAESNTCPFRGYVTNASQEGYSSSVAGYMDDYGLYKMAEAMGLEAEASYYRNRCLKYSLLYSYDIGFFLGRSATGAFSATASTYDPAHWNGPKYDYTESVGWVNAFPATYDGNGLAALYGGRAALGAKLDELFDDSIAAMKKVVNASGHELREFKEVKMGQYEHNNQPAHHIIYTYAFSDKPYKIQEYTREVLRHVYVGSELGQGYPGDEDNGEMSAWYIFNALGFYPYAMASGEYVIGSPLFDKVTVHLDNGNDIVIIANNNSNENVYIQSAALNGESFDRLYITHEELTAGCTLVYEMGNTPSSFGSSESARPTSISSASAISDIMTDLTDGETVSATIPTATGNIGVGTAISGASKLFDNDSLTETAVSDGAQIVFGGKLPSYVELLTLTSGADKSNAPTGFTLEVSNDGSKWHKIAESEIEFTFDRCVQPFAIPTDSVGVYRLYRITFVGGGSLSEVELLGFAELEENITELVDEDLLRYDVNEDGIVSIEDVTTLLMAIANGSELSCDPNGDGVWSIRDVTELLTFLAK